MKKNNPRSNEVAEWVVSEANQVNKKMVFYFYIIIYLIIYLIIGVWRHLRKVSGDNFGRCLDTP